MLSEALSLRKAALLDQALLRRLALPLIVAGAVLLLALPMLQADPAPLTSDQSLYLSEGYNIATGVGPKYTSQEFINHRPPLFPALLAAPIRLAGGDPAAAYWIPKLIVLALAGATFLLGRQLFGPLAGALAALLVTANGFTRWLGTTLFLDGTETLFLLLFLAALWQAFQHKQMRWFALAGALLGLAFLTKETAILWLPLPVAFALLSPEHRRREVVRGLAAYGATVGAILTGWWAWVYAVTDRVYFWGPADTSLLLSIAATLAAAGALACVWALARRVDSSRLPALAAGTGAALVIGWIGLHFAFLELTSWPFPKDHWTSVPQYLWQVAAPNSQPWPLVALGMIWVLARARQDQATRLLALALALFLPFALFVANRTFAYRDLLPMLYIAYIGAAGLAALAIRQAAERAGALPVAGIVIAGVAAFSLIQTQELVDERLPFDRAAVTEANWDNPLVHSTAAWLGEHVPDGASVMASRLYFSQLYVLDEGRHPIHQLPTLRVEPRPGATPFLAPVTTLFRWEDHRLGAASRDERWLYARRYPIKQYYVALSERDLLRDLRERSIDYLVLTGEDAGFSSFTYLDYFQANPAFTEAYTNRPSSKDGVVIYEVDRSQLAFRDYQAAVSGETLDALAAGSGGISREEVAALIDADGVVIRPRKTVPRTE